MSHVSLSEKERETIGINRKLLWLSLGMEEIILILEDLENAMSI